jgi:thiol-disulfide isomerase/thioredoxin
VITFLLFLLGACTPALQSEDTSAYDTQAEEKLSVGIYADGVCGHSIGDEICDLVLKDQNDELWRLYDLKGDVIVLDFSTMWCGPCQSAASTMQAMQDFYDSEGFEYITILIEDTTGGEIDAEDAQEWANLFGIRTQPVLQGSRDLIDGDPSLGYPISSWPTFVFIDRDLEVFWGVYGYSEEYLKAVIEDML